MADFAVAGSSIGGNAVTVTIPAGSGHVALMTWFYEDGGGSGAPTVPGGASVRALGTPGTIPAYFRDGAAYEVTGLSPGSATFTPPSTGGSQVCIVLVASGSSGIGDFVYEDEFVETSRVVVSSPNAGDLVAGAVIGPASDPSFAGLNGSVVRVTSALSSYSGRGAGLTTPRTGVTTNLDITITGSAAIFGVQFIDGAPPPEADPRIRLRTTYYNDIL
jgi:hypothetical protein